MSSDLSLHRLDFNEGSFLGSDTLRLPTAERERLLGSGTAEVWTVLSSGHKCGFGVNLGGKGKETLGLTLVNWSPSRQKQKPEQTVSPRRYSGVSRCVGSVTDLSAMT